MIALLIQRLHLDVKISFVKYIIKFNFSKSFRLNLTNLIYLKHVTKSKLNEQLVQSV